MTAASPRDDGEVCTCGHGPEAHPIPTDCVRCTCSDYRPAAPSEPPATDSPTPGTCRCGHTALHHEASVGCWRCDEGQCSNYPAETQQDDEPLVGAAERATARRVVADWLDRGHSTSVVGLDELRAGIAAALAARPSADTETLRARMFKLAADLDRYTTQRGTPAPGSHDDGVNKAQADAARLIRAALDAR